MKSEKLILVGKRNNHQSKNRFIKMTAKIVWKNNISMLYIQKCYLFRSTNNQIWKSILLLNTSNNSKLRTCYVMVLYLPALETFHTISMMNGKGSTYLIRAVAKVLLLDFIGQWKTLFMLLIIALSFYCWHEHSLNKKIEKVNSFCYTTFNDVELGSIIVK